MAKDAATFANEFMQIFQHASESVREEKQRLQAQIVQLNEQRHAINAQIEAKQNEMDQVEDNMKKGLAHAARQSGVKLELGGSQQKPTSGRISQADMAAACKAVLSVMNGKFTPKSDIAQKAGLAKELVDKAMTKLHRDGKVESNGKRGPIAKWRRDMNLAQA